MSTQPSATISDTTPIAYFCAEFGLTASLPIYAGGLGVLAGDTLKSAADLNLPMVGVGLLYRGEDQIQRLDEEGWQQNETWFFDPLEAGLENVYLDELPLFVRVHIKQVDVWARVWQKKIGTSVTLYLLDTETDQNHLAERNITHALYSGDHVHQLKQQLLLGIGGVKLLHSLGIHPAVYHFNEGRPAFAHWELIRSYMDEHHLSYEQAHQRAISKTVYTNHTLVGAGNPSLPAALVANYSEYYADKMETSVESLVNLGIENDRDQFMSTRFALNTACKASAVSKLHGELSKEAWPGYNWVSITNGVHLPTWQAPVWREKDIEQLTDAEMWTRHLSLKRTTMEYIQRQTGYGYDPSWLVVCWARRIAGYKQYDQLFADVERLKNILVSSDRPVQILLSGKAHFGDEVGKTILQESIKLMSTELAGHVLFVPNYTIEVAQQLVRGSDVWLNTPQLGKEASGTSGMKAVSNGALHCTVADGWAAEVDWQELGWVLDSKQVTETWLQLMEQEIVPRYYHRDNNGVPIDWIKMMRQSFHLSSQFSAQRMVNEYIEYLYNPVCDAISRPHQNHQ